jgi:hypothetical protein
MQLQGERVMKRLLIASLLLASTVFANAEPSLTAKITGMENAGGGDFYILLVVDNTGDVTFKTTHWSCQFYDGEEPISEDRFYVDQVMPNTKTAKRSIAALGRGYVNITKSSCRLLESR